MPMQFIRPVEHCILVVFIVKIIIVLMYRVGSCFNNKEVKELAKLIRIYYSSCLWKKGDILLIDNKKVMHAECRVQDPE